jgi:recombination protein RecT
MTNESPTTQPAKPISQIGQLIVQRKNDVQSISSELQRMLPPAIPAEKFVRTVQTAITMNPDIAKCEKASVLNACMKAASDGLILDGREAALVVYKSKKKTKENGVDRDVYVETAQYMPMVAGIIKRARNSGEISRLNAFIRYENDEFHRTLGVDPQIIHIPNDDNPGKIKGVYAVCKFKDGEIDFEYLPLHKIEQARSRSKSPDAGPWKTDYEEMAKKTAIRRLAKRLPMSSEMGNVIRRVDELHDLDTSEASDAVIGQTDNQPEARASAKKRGGAAAKLKGDQEPSAGQQPAANHESTGAHDPNTGEIVDAEYETMDQQGAASAPSGDGSEDLI